MQIAAAEQMYMEMKNGLSRAGADIQNGAIAVFDVAITGNLGRDEVAAADNFCVAGLRFFQAAQVLLGDNEDVSWRLRINVIEGVSVLVFINLFGRNFASDGSAK